MPALRISGRDAGMPKFAKISRTGVIKNAVFLIFLICCSEILSLGEWFGKN